MFLSRIYKIFLLVSIGSLRSNASPRDSFHLGADSIRPPSQSFDGKEQEVHQLSVESCLLEFQDFQELSSKILSEADELIEKQKNLTAEETILVLGEVGAGKTSLVQLLTENADLQSRKIPETGNYVFEDGQRIGVSTLYPRIVPYNRTINFVDFPGFQNIPQAANEVASSIIMKTITKKLENAKILLLVDYATLQQEDGFINSIRPLHENLRFDFDKYKDHIALIVTKIRISPKSDPPQVQKTSGSDIAETLKEGANIIERVMESPKLDDDGILKVQKTSGSDTAGILEEEANIIERVMEYLNQTQASLEEKLKLEIENEERGFYHDVIELLNSLKAGSKDGKALRINVFYRPNKPGPLRDSELIQQNRDTLLETVKNLNSFDVKRMDFGFVLSSEADMFLKCLLVFLNDHYKNKVNDVVDFVETSAREGMTHDIYFCGGKISDLQSLNDRTGLLMQKLGQVTRYDEFSKAFNSSDLAILSFRYLETRKIIIFNFLEKYGEIILGLVDTSGIFEPSSWTSRVRDASELMKKVEEWCNTLLKFIDGLSSYKMQKQRNEIHDEMYSVKPTYDNVKHLLISMFLNVTGSSASQLFGDGDSQIISEKKLSEIEFIAENMLKKSYDVSCSSQGRLRVKGFMICMSHINSDEFLDSCCGNKPVTDLIIYAAGKVFIDIPNLNGRLEGVDIYLASPHWEVIGERTDIKLVGREGQRVSDSIYMENGKDGKPGLAGGMGGSFYGIGVNFVNCENLHIMSVGGKGGPGIDGADGEPGKDGRTGHEKAVEVLGSKRVLNYLQHEITEAHDSFQLTESILRDEGGNISTSGGELLKLSTYKFGGGCGRVGERGGYGGRGGFGGLGGRFEVVEAGDHRSNITFLSKDGEDGENGRRGQSGEQGKDGVGLTCYNIKTTEQGQVLHDTKSYWKCFETDSKCNHDLEPEIKCGSDYHIDTEIERPSRKSHYRLFQHWSVSYSLYFKDSSKSKLEGNFMAIKALSDFEKFLWLHSD